MNQVKFAFVILLLSFLAGLGGAFTYITYVPRRAARR